MLNVCAAWRVVARHSATRLWAARARFGVFVGLGGAALTGAAIALTNWLVSLGVCL